MTRTRIRSFLASTLVTLACLGIPQAHAAARPLAAAFMAPPLEGQLNVNAATAAQWEMLPGIGPVTAARILEYVAHHPVKHTSQLMRIKGIGRKTYDRLKPFLVIEGDTNLRVASPQADDGPSAAVTQTQTQNQL
jgi:DNA uptake protein ComE-like DNA-binding protein